MENPEYSTGGRRALPSLPLRVPDVPGHACAMDKRAPSATASGHGGFALTQADIEEFKALVERECGVRLDDHSAWNRVIELLNLYRVLLGPTPEDPEARRVQTSSPLLSRPVENSRGVE